MKDTNEILNTLVQLEKLEREAGRNASQEETELLKKQLPPPVVAYYNRCRVSGRKMVAAIGSDGLCDACQASAPRSLMLALQRGDRIQVCDQCGCYLLWDPSLELFDLPDRH